MQLKNSFKKGFKFFATHMEEESKAKVESIEYYPILRAFEHVFGEILGLTPKGDIDFSIDLVCAVSLVSEKPYRMGTMELKELQMQLEEILKKGIYAEVCHLGDPQLFL
jgi:hypothetical protein